MHSQIQGMWRGNLATFQRSIGMTLPTSRRGRFAFVIVAATVVATACVMTAVLANPVSVSSGPLGAEWECQRIVWLTTCTHVSDTPARNWHKETVGLRPA
jgi:hypothetical protein